jgi:prepilin-type N-terminal cleavage/methylation domain-containing protein
VSRHAGITLIELIIALAIFAILAVMVLPNLGGWIAHYRIKGAVREMVSRMELAKIKALKDNLEYRLYMNTDTGAFRIERGNRPSMSFKWAKDGGESSLPPNVSFVEVSFPKTEADQDHERAVQFNPHGTAGSGKAVLKSTREEKYTITVSDKTGKINAYQGEH